MIVGAYADSRIPKGACALVASEYNRLSKSEQTVFLRRCVKAIETATRIQSDSRAECLEFKYGAQAAGVTYAICQKFRDFAHLAKPLITRRLLHRISCGTSRSIWGNPDRVPDPVPTSKSVMTEILWKKCLSPTKRIHLVCGSMRDGGHRAYLRVLRISETIADKNFSAIRRKI